MNSCKNKQLSFKYILTVDNNWSLFKSMYQKELRDDVIQEVEKMLNCCNHKNGFATYICPNCGQTITVPFSCKSKICTTCGKKYTDVWANELSKVLLNVPHQHIVLTVSEKLWPYIHNQPELYKLLMDTAAKTLSKIFSERNKLKTKIIPGLILVLHPFGDDLDPHPHVHILATEGGLSKNNQWASLDFIPYAAVRKQWQYEILTALRKHLPFSIKLNAIIDWCFKNNTNGFYVYIRKINGSKQATLKYIARYIRHPAISSSRIIAYDGTNVTFTYEENYKQLQKTIHKFQFIKAVLQHVIPKGFKVIRRVGLYSRRSKTKYETAFKILQSNPQTHTSNFNWRRNVTQYSGKDPLQCDRCNCKMELYQITYPTPDGYKTVGGLHWIIKGGLYYEQSPPANSSPQQVKQVKEQECCQVHLF